jgi:5,10-methylenetetrahydromethanopterin reductase
VRPHEVSISFQTDKRPAEYAGYARAAEEYGFDVLSMYADLLYQPPIGPLTIVAGATSRIRLGPAALNPYTLHPLEIAGQIATLDSASGGRAYLGLARGAWLDNLGLLQPDAITRMTEALDVVEHLLAGRREPYTGRHFQLSEASVLRYPVERRKIPTMIGTWGRRLIAATADRVDEIKVGGSANPAIVALVTGRAREATGNVPGIVLGAVTIVDEDRATALELIRREMALYLPVVARLDPTVEVDPELLRRMAKLVDQGETAEAGHLIPNDLIARFAFAGTPGDIIAQCEAIFEAGGARIEFGTPHGRTTEEGMRLLGERVLPALAGWR